MLSKENEQEDTNEYGDQGVDGPAYVSLRVRTLGLSVIILQAVSLLQGISLERPAFSP